jgi:hypothetical protein
MHQRLSPVVAELTKRPGGAEVPGLVSITTGTPQRALARDLDGQKRLVTA